MSDQAPAGSRPVSSALPRGRLTRGDVLFGFGRRVRGADGRARLQIVWGRIGVAGAMLAFAAWLTIGFGAWGLLHWRQGVRSVTLLDTLALPWRWSEIQRKRGDHYIAEAAKEFEAGNYAAAFQYLRVGVFKSPANFDGRRRLAQIYALMAQRADQAIKLMEEGLEQSGDNLDYLETYFALLFANQQDERVRELAEERMRAAPRGSRAALVCGLASAHASYFRGRLQEAEDTLARARVERSVEGRMLVAQIKWERGQRDEAVGRLRKLINEPAPPERAYELLGNYLREQAIVDEACVVASLRKLQFPDSLPARLSMLTAWDDVSDRRKIEREVDSVLEDFGRVQGPVLALANFAVATANVALADRLAAVAIDANLMPEISAVMMVEVRIAASDFHGALAAIATVVAEDPEWLKAQADAFAGLQAVAHFGLGQKDLGELYLGKYLGQAAPRAERLVSVGRRLESVGALAAARRVYALATAADANNQPALTGLVRLELQGGGSQELVQPLEGLLTMRKPPLDLLQRAYLRLSQDQSSDAEHETLLSRLRVAIEQQDQGTAL